MVLEQIHIPFAPELAGSVDISNQIADSGIGVWFSKNWQYVVAGVVFICLLVWALSDSNKSKPIVKEEPKPKPTPNSNSLPFQTPKT